MRAPQHSLMTHFKLSLARIEQVGYSRTVQFATSLSAAPPIPFAAPLQPAISGTERSALALNPLHQPDKRGRKPNRMYRAWEASVDAQSLSFGKRQIQRSNRNPDQHRVHWREDWELTAEQRARRISGRKYQATHKEKQRQLALAKES